MEIYQGNNLKKLVEGASINDFKERFILKDLHRYMTSANDRKVCCLYGLRRTGKTIMSLQEIQKLDDYESCIFASCETNDSIHQIKDIVNANSSCKYLFIDEATKATDFIDTCAFLADSYAMRGIKVVLSGTDSLGFILSKNDELYDRMHLLHTTYIPYKEYNYLLGKDLDNYIQYGGTLTESDTFYNKKTSDEYSNTAIVYNIINSLDNWNDGINYANQVLRPVIESRELSSFINKVIEYPTREFFDKIINDVFKYSHDLRSVCQIVKKHNIADSSQLKKIAQEKVENIREILGIKAEHTTIATPEMVNAIIDYLKEMDVLYQVPKIKGLYEAEDNEYIFTQVGMKCCQATALAEILEKSDEFEKKFDKEERAAILNKLYENIYGGILEDIVFCQIAKANTEYGVAKYRNGKNQEIDVLVLDNNNNTIFAIEVKHSSELVENQYHHLTNPDFCSEIEGKTGMLIANKAVVYRGCNSESKGVLFINAEDFLSRSQEMLKVLLTHRDIKTFNQLEELIKKGSVGNGDDEKKANPPKKKSKSDYER